MSRKEKEQAGSRPAEAVRNRRARDNGAKLIFEDPILCAQFLRGYTDIEL